MDSKLRKGEREGRSLGEHFPASSDHNYRPTPYGPSSTVGSKMATGAELAPSRLTPVPRLLNRQQAAEYCSISPSAFSSWVRSGKLPPSLPGTTRWDLKAIDFALDAMSGLQQQELTALDVWRAKRARRSKGNS